MAEAILGFVGLAMSVASMIELTVKTTHASLKFLEGVQNAGRDFVLSRYWLTRHLDRYQKFLEFWSVSENSPDERFLALWGVDGKRRMEASLEVLKMYVDEAQSNLEDAGKGLLGSGRRDGDGGSSSARSLRKRILGKVRLVPKNRITAVDENGVDLQANPEKAGSSAAGSIKGGSNGNAEEKWQLAFDAMSIQSGASTFRKVAYAMKSQEQMQSTLDEIGKCLDALVKDAELFFFTHHPEVSQGNLSVAYIKRVVSESDSEKKAIEDSKRGDEKFDGALTRSSTLYSTPPDEPKSYEVVLRPPAYTAEDGSLGSQALTVRRRFTEDPPAYSPKFELHGSQLTIESEYIMAALREVIKYYPAQDLSYKSLVLEEPYPLLVHNYIDLKEYYNSGGIRGEAKTHLGQLLEFLEVDRATELRQLDAMRSEAERECSFKDYWLLFNPGTIVITDTATRAFCVLSSEYKKVPPPDRASGYNTVFKILTSYIDYDGKWFVRHFHHFTVSQFNGQKQIDFLPVYPLELDPGVENQKRGVEIANKLLLRGYRYCRTTIVNQKLQECYDQSIEGGSPERVMIDYQLYHQLDSEGWDIVKNAPALSYLDNCECEICSRTRTSLAQDLRDFEGTIAKYKSTGPRPPHSTATPQSYQLSTLFSEAEEFREFIAHQNPRQTAFESIDQPVMFLLLPSHVRGFVLSQCAWKDLLVSNIREPEFDEKVWDSVVLDDDKKELLLSLTELSSSFSNGALLQGQPGTGKTHTAMALAECTKKPLMSLTAKDIIEFYKGVGNINFGELTRLANKWGAILLLDDANSIFDFVGQDAREGLTKVLSQTTNPMLLVSNLYEMTEDNEAFLAKLSLLIYFPNNQQVREKILRGTLARLSPDIFLDSPPDSGVNDHVDSIVSRWAGSARLDGHAITSISKTAVQLAARKGEKLRMEHINLVIYSHGSWEAQNLRGRGSMKEQQQRQQQQQQAMNGQNLNRFHPIPNTHRPF